MAPSCHLTRLEQSHTSGEAGGLKRAAGRVRERNVTYMACGPGRGRFRHTLNPLNGPHKVSLSPAVKPRHHKSFHVSRMFHSCRSTEGNPESLCWNLYATFKAEQ